MPNLEQGKYFVEDKDAYESQRGCRPSTVHIHEVGDGEYFLRENPVGRDHEWVDKEILDDLFEQGILTEV